MFVLPLEEDLVSGFDVPLDDYATHFYQHMNDAFDFLIFFADHEQFPFASKGGFYLGVSNDVQGIGKSAFFSGRYGSAGKLQGVIFMSVPPSLATGHTSLVHGPMLHELMHRWANFIVSVPTDYTSHWGYSSANGLLGGFDIATLVDHGGGRYSADQIAPAGWGDNLQPYSPIELYLAGLIPPDEVPDLWVAEDADLGGHEEGYGQAFVANRVKTYKIEDIIAEHGPRVPDHTQAQKDFRAAVILLIIEDRANSSLLEMLSNDASLFSYPGEDQDAWYNFYEATGGRATITMDGLSQFQSRAGAKRVVPNSYGTPPPPIVCDVEQGHSVRTLHR